MAVKKGKIRNLNMNTAENKQLTTNPELLHQKLLELTEPKPKIAKEDLERPEK
ncbi:MAG: hypothetical protein ABIA92_01550 [Patescibacteria group bacterium]